MSHKSTLLFIVLFLSFCVRGQKNSSKDVNHLVSDLLKNANESNENNGIKAVSYLDEALEYEGKAADTVKIKLYQTAGNIYLYQESYYQAIKYFNKLLEQEKNSNSIYTMTYNSLGAVYWRLDDKPKAKEYWDKSLEALKRLKEKDRNPGSYIVYNNLAVYERSEKNYTKALEMLKEYVKYSIKLKDTAGLVKAYQNISYNSTALKEYDTASAYLHKAKNLAKKSNLINDLGSIYYNLGSFYNDYLVNKDSAKYYSLKAFELGDRHQFPFIKRLSSEFLVKVYEDENNIPEAYRYLHIAKALGEEMATDENLKKINQLEQEHQLKMREQALIAKQKKKDTLYVVSSVILILSIIIVLLVLSLQKNKLKRRTAENGLLASQLEEKNKALTENAIQMLQTSEMIDATHKELAGLKSAVNIPTKNMLSKIIADLKSGPKGFNKEEFEKLLRKRMKISIKTCCKSILTLPEMKSDSVPLPK